MNLTGFTQTIDSGTTVGTLVEVDEETQLSGETDDVKSATINQLVTSDELMERRQRLASMFTVGDPGLQEALLEYHHLFSLDEEERGETDLIQLNIDTGEASPIEFEFELNYWTDSILICPGAACSPINTITSIDYKLISYLASTRIKLIKVSYKKLH